MSVNQKVVDAIRSIPEMCRSEIIFLLSDVSQKQVSNAISRMVHKGQLAVTEKPNPAERGPRVVQAYTWVGNQKAKRQPVTDPVVGLKARIAELEAWKADAIARFPDLATDPVVLEARKIAAAEFDTDPAMRDAILAGRKDECAIMRAVTAALSRGA